MIDLIERLGITNKANSGTVPVVYYINEDDEVNQSGHKL